MRLVIAVLLAILTAIDVADAQGAPRPQTRQGFTAAVGLGYGSAALSCDGCANDRESGVGVRLLLGGALKPNLILAGEIEGWSKELEGGTVTLAWVSFVAQWYPAAARGVFVKGGVGLSGASLEARNGLASSKLETAGPGLVVGAGYDIRVGKNFSLTPFADFLFAARADAKVSGNSTNQKLGGNLLHVGLAATWH